MADFDMGSGLPGEIDDTDDIMDLGGRRGAEGLT